MTGSELLTEKVLKVQKTLNQWAKKEGILQTGEVIVVSLQIFGGENYLNMSPEEFFSEPRLKNTGLPRILVTRAYNHIRGANLFYDGNKPPGERSSLKHKTMKDFLSEYNDVRRLLRIRNLGRKSVPVIVKAIRDAGLSIGDSFDIFK